MTLLRVYNKNGNDVANSNDQYRYSDLMQEFFGDSMSNYSAPKVNIIERNETFEVQMALPGVKKEDIKINVDKDIMTVSHSVSGENSDECYTRKEFDFNDFERSFNLPESVNTEKISAGMQDGILYIHLSKREESIDKGPKEIKIS